jgi:hypothetical protein
MLQEHAAQRQTTFSFLENGAWNLDASVRTRDSLRRVGWAWLLRAMLGAHLTGARDGGILALALIAWVGVDGEEFHGFYSHHDNPCRRGGSIAAPRIPS